MTATEHHPRADLYTDTGITVQEVYTGTDALAPPGTAPYPRGIHPTMYRGRPWTIRQLAGFGTAEDTNHRLRLLLGQGATGVNCVFDYPTNRGYDSDDPIAAADAGQGGVAIDTVQDMEALFDGVPIDTVSVSLVLSHPVAAGVVLAMYLVAARRRGYDWRQLAGTLQNDFLMETVVLTAPVILQPSFAYRLSMDVVEFCAREMPRWNPISFTGYNYREAGADAVQEVALVVAQAAAAVNELTRRGLSPDSAAGRLSAFFSADNDFFEEIAKFRAARWVYHEVLSAAHNFERPRSTALRFHVQTSGCALTAQQPLNNIARASFQALAAVLGGAQSLHVSAYDEAVSIPSEAAALTALRTQQILLHETGVTRTADPLGGSFYVEHLTAQLRERVRALLAHFDAAGGLVAAVESGLVHRMLLDHADELQRAVTEGSRAVVGVNCLREDQTPAPAPFRAPQAAGAQQDKLNRLRAHRDTPAVDAALRRLRRTVVDATNVMPALMVAADAGASLGECCTVFRDLYGGFRQPLA